MVLLLVAGLLFGLVHPGCKWLTSGGLGLLPFCLLFVGSRILFQLPVVWKSGGVHAVGKQWGPLIALGFVGAGLRVTEFLGIVEGLPVSLVSFLIYLHPVWTIFFGRWLNKEPIDIWKVGRIGAALVGTALICDLSSITSIAQLSSLWSPVVAGMLISLWICLSTRAQHAGVSVVSVSFYYDVFTFVPLLTYSLLNMGGAEWAQMASWISSPTNLGLIAAYTLITGVLPNYAFYIGLRRSTALAAALLMLFEPIASTLIAVAAWHEPISSAFFEGAALILLINIPDRALVAMGHRLSRLVPKRQPTRLQNPPRRLATNH